MPPLPPPCLTLCLHQMRALISPCYQRLAASASTASTKTLKVNQKHTKLLWSIRHIAAHRKGRVICQRHRRQVFLQAAGVQCGGRLLAGAPHHARPSGTAHSSAEISRPRIHTPPPHHACGQAATPPPPHHQHQHHHTTTPQAHTHSTPTGRPCCPHTPCPPPHPAPYPRRPVSALSRRER